MQSLKLVYLWRAVAISMLCMANFANAQLAPPANVVEPNITTSDNQKNDKVPLPEVIERFALLYKKQGQPRIAILWNKQFDAVVSEWELSPAQLKYAEKLRINTNDDLLEADFEQQSTLVNRRHSTQRRSPIELDFEYFKTSFVDAFLRANTNLVDSDTIIRLKGNADNGKEAYQLDSKKLETQAFIGYSDLVMELLFIPTPKSALGYSASVEITDINTGSTLAKLINKLPKPKYEKRWEASENGFALKVSAVDIPSFSSIGEDLARDTMVKLVERWQ